MTSIPPTGTPHSQQGANGPDVTKCPAMSLKFWVSGWWQPAGNQSFRKPEHLAPIEERTGPMSPNVPQCPSNFWASGRWQPAGSQAISRPKHLARYNEQKERMSESVRKCQVLEYPPRPREHLPAGIPSVRPPRHHPSTSRNDHHNLTIMSKMQQDATPCNKSWSIPALPRPPQPPNPDRTTPHNLHPSVLSVPSVVNSH